MADFVNTMATVLGQLITDSMPLLYFMFAFIMIGLVFAVFLGGIKNMFRQILR